VHSIFGNKKKSEEKKPEWVKEVKNEGTHVNFWKKRKCAFAEKSEPTPRQT